MSLIKVTRIKNTQKMTKTEFIITKAILDALDAEYDSDHSILLESSYYYCGDKVIALPEHYTYVNDELDKDLILFRPLRNERHSNILIDMFEELKMSVPMDRLEINEYLNKNDKVRYSGYIIVNGNKMPNSYVKGSPSIPILKTSIIAQVLFKEGYSNYSYEDFSNLITQYLNEQKR